MFLKPGPLEEQSAGSSIYLSEADARARSAAAQPAKLTMPNRPKRRLWKLQPPPRALAAGADFRDESLNAQQQRKPSAPGRKPKKSHGGRPSKSW